MGFDVVIFDVVTGAVRVTCAALVIGAVAVTTGVGVAGVATNN